MKNLTTMKCTQRRRLWWLAALVLLVSLTTPAATLTWNNPAGGTWSVATNWSPNQVPGAGDSALITLNGMYTVMVDGAITMGSLTLGGSSGQQILATSGNSLTLNEASSANAHSVV